MNNEELWKLCCATKPQKSKIELLLDQDINPNMINEGVNLLSACKGEKIASLLIESGADPNIIDESGYFFYKGNYRNTRSTTESNHSIVRKKKNLTLELVKSMFNQGFDFRAKDRSDQDTIHILISNKIYESLIFLLEQSVISTIPKDVHLSSDEWNRVISSSASEVIIDVSQMEILKDFRPPLRNYLKLISLARSNEHILSTFEVPHIYHCLKRCTICKGTPRNPIIHVDEELLSELGKRVRKNPKIVCTDDISENFFRHVIADLLHSNQVIDRNKTFMTDMIFLTNMISVSNMIVKHPMNPLENERLENEILKRRKNTSYWLLLIDKAFVNISRVEINDNYYEFNPNSTNLVSVFFLINHATFEMSLQSTIELPSYFCKPSIDDLDYYYQAVNLQLNRKY
jgi:hypothetical protein